MILILEDDNDREAYQRGGSPFRQDFYTEDEDKNPVTVWISPEAYRKETMLDGLRAKVHTLPLGFDEKERPTVLMDDVIALFDD